MSLAPWFHRHRKAAAFVLPAQAHHATARDRHQARRRACAALELEQLTRSINASRER